jgi:rhomboid protease GluP
LQPFHDVLKQRTPQFGVTKIIIALNCLVFAAMLINGAGFWHSQNGVQLAWGANFGPATQDGQWWRLASAMFLHFGALHLLLNMWSLWDAGQLVERMYGHARFICLYVVSGLLGNLVSLVFQGNSAVSGGASGAIFGIYGALLVFLWRERAGLSLREFRWLFWGALGFALVTIVLGFVISGIDNAAHIGGFITGILISIVLVQPITTNVMPLKINMAAVFVLVIVTVALVLNVPAPKYRWSDELLLRNQINEFLYQDQAINRSWLEILNESKRGTSTVHEIAGQVDSAISEPYEDSFEKLSRLPHNAALPSALQLESLLNYAKQRKEESRALAAALRQRDVKNNAQATP